MKNSKPPKDSFIKLIYCYTVLLFLLFLLLFLFYFYISSIYVVHQSDSFYLNNGLKAIRIRYDTNAFAQIIYKYHHSVDCHGRFILKGNIIMEQEVSSPVCVRRVNMILVVPGEDKVTP